jgi:hypothetical protein
MDSRSLVGFKLTSNPNTDGNECHEESSGKMGDANHFQLHSTVTNAKTCYQKEKECWQTTSLRTPARSHVEPLAFFLEPRQTDPPLILVGKAVPIPEIPHTPRSPFLPKKAPSISHKKHAR